MVEILKKNIKNKSWWVAVISALVLLGQSHGLDLTKYIGANWNDTLNTVFSLAVLFGISVDTTAVSPSSVTENQIQTDSDSTNDNVNVSSNSTDSIESDVKNAIVVNSTIVPKANTADDTTNANA
ncbi:phage holin [Clostridium sp. BL-8]|uniref:phage holin n=1 Tax=Clostridium sp. BL-8 TaxID=349938 RepID=UPI00098CE575|nr:phage holin [Clostridium sp. BL-8]OOM76563.1 bacteriophage holin [Clostridium sp. BL-8]